MHKYRFTCFLTIQHLSTNLFLLVYGAQRYFNFQNIKMAGITDFKDASSLIECAMVMQNSCCLITYERAKSICMCGPGCFVPFVKSNGSVTLQKSSGYCPSEFVKNLDNCFIFDFSPKLWNEATDTCLNRSTILVEPKSIQDISFVKQRSIAYNHGFWLGGINPVGSITGWIWGTSYEAIETADWGPGQPELPLEKTCMRIRAKGEFFWRSTYCTNEKKRTFICQRPTL